MGASKLVILKEKAEQTGAQVWEKRPFSPFTLRKEWGK